MQHIGKSLNLQGLRNEFFLDKSAKLWPDFQKILPGYGAISSSIVKTNFS